MTGDTDTLPRSVTDLGDAPWGKSLVILIVEDHEIVREGLHRLVSRALTPQVASLVVHYAASLRETREVICQAEGRLDLILLDLELEDAGAAECIASIRDTWIGLPIAVVSANDDWRLAGELMELGVLGVIPKKSNVGIIANAIRLITAGGRYFPEDLLRHHQEWSQQESDVYAFGRDVALTGTSARDAGAKRLPPTLAIDHELMSRLSPRQQSVLALMVEGMSNKEIAKTLGLSVGTAKNYVSSILRVLGAARRGTAIRIATTLKVRSQDSGSV